MTLFGYITVLQTLMQQESEDPPFLPVRVGRKSSVLNYEHTGL